MKDLYLTVGPPGSGKSTYVNKFFEQDLQKFQSEKDFLAVLPKAKVKIISRDAIRFKLLAPDDDYFAKEKEVYQTFVRQTKEALNADDDYTCVVADATFLTQKRRKEFCKAIGVNMDEVTYIYFATPLADCWKNNENRVGREYVPNKVIENMYRSLELPEEDQTITIQIDTEGGFIW